MTQRSGLARGQGRLQRRIAEARLQPEQAALYFVGIEDGASRLDKLALDRFGNITTSAAATRSDRTTYRPSSRDDAEEPSRTHTRSDTAQASIGYTWGGTNRATLSWSDSSTRDLLGTELDSGYSSLSGSVSYVPTDGLTILLNKSRSASSGATYLSTSTIDDGLDDGIDSGIGVGLDGDTDLLSNRDALLNRAWNRRPPPVSSEPA